MKDKEIFDVILSPRKDKYTLFPIEMNDVFDYYQKAKEMFWVPEEVDLVTDQKQWGTLSEGEKHFIKYVLAFFAASDGIVNENLCLRFSTEVQPAEVRQFYAMQIGIEAIHSHMYSLLIETFIKDNKEKEHLFSAIETVPAIKKKADWALKWIASDAPFAQRLVAFACIEGIHFSGSFCAIFWLKKRGLMPGLAMSNEFISRDEGLHRDFACLIHSKLSEPCSEDLIRQIVTESVEIEKEFITEALPVSLLGMNSEHMIQYIELVADHLLVTLGLPKMYNVTNPFPWMDMISLQGKTNFFERRVSEYKKSTGSVSEDEFSMDEEF
jgi:ribonucleotide reductase beta subunit family protein with ferritin-like domain